MTEVINPIKRDWLVDLRKKKKISSREMARIFAVSSTHYNDIENGIRNPSIELSKQIAKFFNVSAEKFFNERTKFRR